MVYNRISNVRGPGRFEERTGIEKDANIFGFLVVLLSYLLHTILLKLVEVLDFFMHFLLLLVTLLHP